jgi:hypothetical protein
MKGSCQDMVKVLYCTLQAHRLMQEFKSKQLIHQSSMMMVLLPQQFRAGIIRKA